VRIETLQSNTFRNWWMLATWPVTVLAVEFGMVSHELERCKK
jgi:hypothetical protein